MRCKGWTNLFQQRGKQNTLIKLLKVGFDTIDFGSFVSPKAIPQLRDTVDVLKKLDLSDTKSKLLCNCCKHAGAEEATKFDAITYLVSLFPFLKRFSNAIQTNR